MFLVDIRVNKCVIENGKLENGGTLMFVHDCSKKSIKE